MASVTTWTTAWARSTLAACATVLVQFTSVDVKTFQPAIATATAAKKTPWACAVVAQQMMMRMASVTTWTTAWARSMLAACATAPVRFMSADAKTFQLAIATATAAKKTPWACAVVTAQQMLMQMAFVTTWTTAWARSTRAVCAMALARFTSADVRTLQHGDCDCNGNQLDALGVCGGDCTEDADADGICDDVDDCIGELDALGECNGPCAADTNGNDICDSDEGIGLYG